MHIRQEQLFTIQWNQYFHVHYILVGILFNSISTTFLRAHFIIYFATKTIRTLYSGFHTLNSNTHHVIMKFIIATLYLRKTNICTWNSCTRDDFFKKWGVWYFPLLWYVTVKTPGTDLTFWPHINPKRYIIPSDWRNRFAWRSRLLFVCVPRCRAVADGWTVGTCPSHKTRRLARETLPVGKGEGTSWRMPSVSFSVRHYRYRCLLCPRPHWIGW